MIRLFKNEDAASSMNASTFLHESAHYWLDTMLRTAKVLLEQQADSQRPISQQSERLLVLTSKFMQWGGAYDPKKDLSFRDAVDRWLASSTDEQRAFQEKFARGMEAYIKEGKAPAEGLQKVFEQFAAWLKEVYVTLRRTLDVELSPEVASLYDQLLCLSRRCRMRVTAGTTQVCSTRWLRRACRRTTSVLLSTFESLRDSRQKGRFARI